jgi:hypothetical protein
MGKKSSAAGGNDSGAAAGRGDAGSQFLSSLMTSTTLLVVLAVIGCCYQYRDGIVWMLTTNHTLQAIVVPTAMAGLVYQVTMVVRALYSKISALFYSSVTMSNKDENFEVILDYIAKRYVTENSSLMATTKKKEQSDQKDWRREYNGLPEREAPKMEVSRSIYLNLRYLLILLIPLGDTTFTLIYTHTPLLSSLCVSYFHSSAQTITARFTPSSTSSS